MNPLPTISITPPPPPVQSPMPIVMPVPLSYEFQVVEFIDDTGKILRVSLQVKQNQHDQYGNISVHGTWNDVPRIQVKF